MNKHALKILVVALVAGMNWLGFSAVGTTRAFFSDIETVVENSFSAAGLDFSLTNNAHDIFLGTMLGEDYSFSSVITKTEDSLPFHYRTRAEKISGSDVFCDSLNLEALHSELSYEGDLLSLETETTSVLGTWSFEIDRGASSLAEHGENCVVDIVFYGWQEGSDTDSGGFSDEERIRLSVTSRTVVLNEFLPNPEAVAYGFDFGKDSDSMPQGEWVEVYNTSENAIDLSGWYIRDAHDGEGNKVYITAENTVPSSTTIGAREWLVVYLNKQMLNNNGDTVRLYDAAGHLVDAHTYDGADYCELEPTPGEENTTDADGRCSSVPPNKSYARIPDGVGGWVDPVPTPGFANSREEIMEVKSLKVEETGLVADSNPMPSEQTDSPLTEEQTEHDEQLSGAELSKEGNARDGTVASGADGGGTVPQTKEEEVAEDRMTTTEIPMPDPGADE